MISATTARYTAHRALTALQQRSLSRAEDIIANAAQEGKYSTVILLDSPSFGIVDDLVKTLQMSGFDVHQTTASLVVSW